MISELTVSLSFMQGYIRRPGLWRQRSLALAPGVMALTLNVRYHHTGVPQGRRRVAGLQGGG